MVAALTFTYAAGLPFASISAAFGWIWRQFRTNTMSWLRPYPPATHTTRIGDLHVFVSSCLLITPFRTIASLAPQNQNQLHC